MCFTIAKNHYDLATSSLNPLFAKTPDTLIKEQRKIEVKASCYYWSTIALYLISSVGLFFAASIYTPAATSFILLASVIIIPIVEGRFIAPFAERADMAACEIAKLNLVNQIYQQKIQNKSGNTFNKELIDSYFEAAKLTLEEELKLFKEQFPQFTNPTSISESTIFSFLSELSNRTEKHVRATNFLENRLFKAFLTVGFYQYQRSNPESSWTFFKTIPFTKQLGQSYTSETTAGYFLTMTPTESHLLDLEGKRPIFVFNPPNCHSPIVRDDLIKPIYDHLKNKKNLNSLVSDAKRFFNPLLKIRSVFDESKTSRTDYKIW